MAIVDGLLHSLPKGEGRLVLAPGEPPIYDTDGRRTPLSAATLDVASIRGLLEEVAPEGCELGPSAGDSGAFVYGYDGRDYQFAPGGAAGVWTARAQDTDRQGAETQKKPAAIPSRAEPDGQQVESIESLLALLLERRASDLHLVAGQKPWLRVDGSLRPLERFAPPASETLEELLHGVMNERSRNDFETTNDADFALDTGTARFRVNVFRDRLGAGAVFRHIPLDVPSFEQLGLPDCLRDVCSASKGLVLVTGPTGSGKSTTLAAMVDLINRTREEHIITIEDPVEFVHSSQSCLINQREVGEHTGSFNNALRAALREDPDIVLVGEMRDLETVSMAIETAATGHLVFATLHTTTAPATVERIIGQFPGDLQEQTRMMLSDGLRAVVAQSLLERKTGGRVAAFEILLGTAAVSNIIREGKTHQLPSAMQTGRAQGMTTMTDSLADLVEEEVVEVEEAMRHAGDREALEKKLKGVNPEMVTHRASPRRVAVA